MYRGKSLRGAGRGSGQVGEDIARPGLHVLVPNAIEHGLPAGLALVQRHVERKADVVRDIVGAVRIDQQSPFQLLCRSREPAQDQNPRVGGILRRDVFLRDQVHAVAQRRDQPDLARVERPVELCGRMSLVDVPYRHEVDTAVCAVDLAGLLLEQRAYLLVAVDILAARRGDLDEHEVPDPVGMPLEEAADPIETFGQTLRIIEPVHPDHRGPAARARRPRRRAQRRGSLRPRRRGSPTRRARQAHLPAAQDSLVFLINLPFP